MTQYSTLNLKWSNSQLNELKFRLKNGTNVSFFLLLPVSEKIKMKKYLKKKNKLNQKFLA